MRASSLRDRALALEDSSARRNYYRLLATPDAIIPRGEQVTTFE
jgi:hypothetical protein